MFDDLRSTIVAAAEGRQAPEVPEGVLLLNMLEREAKSLLAGPDTAS